MTQKLTQKQNETAPLRARHIYLFLALTVTGHTQNGCTD